MRTNTKGVIAHGRFAYKSRPVRYFVAAARWRSTYCRMPPCATYSTSCGVSTRAITVNVLAPALHRQLLLRDDARRDAVDLDDLVAGEAERGRVLAGLELQRQDAHADQVRAVDALEALRDHRAHAEQQRALRGPVARAAGAVLVAGDDDQRHALVLRTASRRRRSPSARPSGMCLVKPPSTPCEHQVLEADVRERAAHHDLVVAAARAVLVVVARLHAVLVEVPRRRASPSRCCRPARCDRS